MSGRKTFRGVGRVSTCVVAVAGCARPPSEPARALLPGRAPQSSAALAAAPNPFMLPSPSRDQMPPFSLITNAIRVSPLVAAATGSIVLLLFLRGAGAVLHHLSRWSEFWDPLQTTAKTSAGTRLTTLFVPSR
jgi:hypothetical protein